MRIVVTGSSGRVGRAISSALHGQHEVVGIDRTVFSTTKLVGDFVDRAFLERALDGVDAVIHTAALHSPHVSVISDEEFKRINVDGTRLLAETAKNLGIRRFVFTSTTALYGKAIAEGACTWVDERTLPQPKSIYHRTKLAAESFLTEVAGDDFVVRILRMSRCFPEPAHEMAAYRLHRGIDVRDVADAHVLALYGGVSKLETYVISGTTPFEPGDCPDLAQNLERVLNRRAPEALEMFRRRGWKLPGSIDHVYSPKKAERDLGWKSRYGSSEVAAQLDRRSLEVLPVDARMTMRPE